MTNTYFVDLHIHIGRTLTGKAVKITASDSLTLANLVIESSTRKGIDMIGVIDCHVPEVLAEIKQAIRAGQAKELVGGGIQYKDTTLILGTEMEIYDENCLGPIHVLCYLPSLDDMSAFSEWMSQHQKNIHLSSQRTYVQGQELQRRVRAQEGLFIPAHIFTPFKSLYGKGVNISMQEVFDPQDVDAVELGLSSDTHMADQLEELHAFPFLTNSDAHSVAKIGREYQKVQMIEPDYKHLVQAIKGQSGQMIVSHYGLDPKLGKYHQEVSKRIRSLAQQQKELLSQQGAIQWTQKGKQSRPPYVHQVPLEYIPKLGPKTLERLIGVFGSEMAVLHEASEEDLLQWTTAEIARNIAKARNGELQIQTGGKGIYGRVEG